MTAVELRADLSLQVLEHVLDCDAHSSVPVARGYFLTSYMSKVFASRPLTNLLSSNRAQRARVCGSYPHTPRTFVQSLFALFRTRYLHT
jgi:hypothetical protein